MLIRKVSVFLHATFHTQTVVNNTKSLFALIELFDKTSEVIKGPSSNNENPFNYYHKSNRKDMALIRKTLEKWFLEYPEAEKVELKNRFKKDMDSAFFELFLYQMFKKLGFEITIHPEIKDSRKRPDFLISKNDFEAYAEAKICYDKSEAEMAFERRRNEFYDKLNKARIKGFLLRIEELNFKTKKQPRVKELISKIENEVSVLDTISVTAKMKKYGLEGCPRIDYENEDFQICVQPMPLVESKRNKISKNPIGMFPFESFWGGGEDSLRESILKKAKRYGKFKIPYLICINALGRKTSGKTDIENVIWGSLKYTYSTNPENRNGRMTRERNGVFYNAGIPKLTNVSGIFITNVFPSSIPNAKYWLYEHPFCQNKMDFTLLNLVYNYVEGNQIISQEGADLDKIFGISKDWLS